MNAPPAYPSGSGSRTVDVALAIPVVGDEMLVARRPEGTHLAGAWEFPGGKIVDGEEPSAAARRELAEETGLVAERLEPLLVLVHEYPEHPVRLHVFIARDPSGEVRIGGSREWGWRTLRQLRELEMPPANAPILNALRWRVP
jgi:8-oxo-dGTP diphosphatase